MTFDRQAARARCEAATAPNCGPGGVDITGGIRSDIYVRLGRDDCSDSIYDYIYELLASVRQLGQDGIAALDALDAKDKEIERLTRQVENFRDGLQGARDLYREKSGKPDRFSDEGDWWQNPDDQCVVLWLIEWAEDIQSDLIERLRRALLRIANGDFMGAGSLEIARAALEGRECERA